MGFLSAADPQHVSVASLLSAVTAAGMSLSVSRATVHGLPFYSPRGERTETFPRASPLCPHFSASTSHVAGDVRDGGERWCHP